MRLVEWFRNALKGKEPENKRVPAFIVSDIVDLKNEIDEGGINIPAGRYTVIGIDDKNYTLGQFTGSGLKTLEKSLPIAFVERNFEHIGSSWDKAPSSPRPLR
jgi:hypothetical protein